MVAEPTNILNLPNELLAQIWQRMAPRDRRSCRAVCTRWLFLHERCNFPRTQFLNLDISIREDQYVLFGRKRNKSSSAIEIAPCWSFLSSAFRMMELSVGSHIHKFEPRGGVLSIEGRALTDDLLVLINEQNWNIRSLELNGDLTVVRNETLHRFVADQNSDNGLIDIKSLVIKDATINNGLVSDCLLSSFNGKLCQMHVDLTLDCEQLLTETSLTDTSLPLVVRPNSTFFLSPSLTSRITMPALQASIKKYFETEWNRMDVPPSSWRNERGRLVTYEGYYSFTLTLYATASVTAHDLAQVEMPGVEKVFFAVNAGSLHEKTVEKEEMCERGHVLFVKRSPDSCVVARIGVC